MATAPIPLTDRQLAAFVANGFVVLRSSLPTSFHARMRQTLGGDTVAHGFDNNFVPRYPIIHELLEEPVVRGALSSVLGEDYYLQPHRHGHTTAPGTGKAGGWHKDSYWGYAKTRRHMPWMAMIMYYPQETVLEMGPTLVIPGSPRLLRNPLPTEENGDPASPYVGHQQLFPEGTLLLIDYHVWHAGAPNTSDRSRFMFKLEFSRQTPPAPRPQPAFVPPATRPYHDQPLVWQRVWDFLHGVPAGKTQRPAGADLAPAAALAALGSEDATQRLRGIDSLASHTLDTPEVAAALAARLADRSEALAQDAAYALAALPTHGHATLLRLAADADGAIATCAAQGLAAAGPKLLPALLQALGSASDRLRVSAAFALGEYHAWADDALLAALIAAATDRVDDVRRHALESLGLLGRADAAVLQALAAALGHSDTQSRWTAAWSLLRLASRADAAAAAELVAPLSVALHDENRYVKAYALDALACLPDAAARQLAIRHYGYRRWCAVTDGGHPFYP